MTKFQVARRVLLRVEDIFTAASPDDICTFFITPEQPMSADVFSYAFKLFIEFLGKRIDMSYWFRVFHVQKKSRRIHAHVMLWLPGIRIGSTYVGPGNNWRVGKNLLRMRRLLLLSGRFGLGRNGCEPLRPGPIMPLINYLGRYLVGAICSKVDPELQGGRRLYSFSRLMPRYEEEDYLRLDDKRRLMYARICNELNCTEAEIPMLAEAAYPHLASALALKEFWRVVISPLLKRLRDTPF